MKNLFKKIFLGFYKVHLAKKYDLRIGKNVTINKSNSYGGYNALSKNALLISSHIGFASYIGERTVLRNVEIGKYTSIGPDVKCVFGKHPSSDFVSTHPAFFSVRGQSGFSYVSEQLFEEFEQPLDPNGKYQIRIGNDVWIGAGVSLMDGVSIGDGAIIASNALVTKDVPAYSIVGGVPAKFIKNRFKADEIKFLLDLKWWSKDEEWIAKNADAFTDIAKFRQHVGAS